MKLGSNRIISIVACSALGVLGCESPDVGSTTFPATPADGPMPAIGPAPDTYRPTAAGAPRTDIWLGMLVRDGDELIIQNLSNATDRDGYDNQPSFAQDGSAIYYVSAVDSTQTEVFRYVTRSGAIERVTNTEGVSEFSPTMIPAQDAFSAIHEIRGKQYLWRYGSEGGDIGAIFSTAEPVGYHAWADEYTVAMFVLGSPATLQVGNALTGGIRVVAESPGRSIHRIPDSNEVSFVRKVSEDEWWIERLNPQTGDTERLTRTVPAAEDYAWTPEGEIIMGKGSTLHRWTTDTGWTEFQDLVGVGIEGITRLAVSPDGTMIAIVANRSAA
jgi:hypothetical protein